MFGASSVNRASLIKFTLCTKASGEPITCCTLPPLRDWRRGAEPRSYTRSPRGSSEERRVLARRLAVEELRDEPADGDDDHQDDPALGSAVEGGEVVRDHDEHERYAHVRVVLAPQAGHRHHRRLRRWPRALHSADDLALPGPDPHPHVRRHDGAEEPADVDERGAPRH